MSMSSKKSSTTSKKVSEKIVGEVRRGTPEWERLRAEISGQSKTKKGGKNGVKSGSAGGSAGGSARGSARGSGGRRSDHADDAAIILARNEIGGFVREYRFHPVRLWRFDLANVRIKVALEIEGVNRFQSHPGYHRSVEGFTGDCEKYSEAAIEGWCVIRATTEMMNDGRMVDLVRRAIESRKGMG